MTLGKAFFLKANTNRFSVGSREGTHGNAVTQTYTIALVVSTVIHLVVCFPIFATSLFPDMLPTQTVALHWRRLLVPPKWTSTDQISSMGEGAWNFLGYDYYLGTMAALIWSAIACYDLQRTKLEDQAVTRNILRVVVWGIDWRTRGGTTHFDVNSTFPSVGKSVNI